MDPKHRRKNKKDKKAPKKQTSNEQEASDLNLFKDGDQRLAESKAIKEHLDDATGSADHRIFVINNYKNNNEEKNAVNLYESFISKFDIAMSNEGNSGLEIEEGHSNINESVLVDSSNNHSGIKNKNIMAIVEFEDKASVEEDIVPGGELKTIEDYIALGIQRQIAEMKHPLEHSWSFWYYMNDKTRTWEQNQQKIAEVDTIEDFWQVYNFIEPASKIGHGCDYSVFKKGIMPDWEDFQNMSGGRWIINSDKSVRSQVIDHYWIETLFILIGEHAGEYAKMVNGAVINIRNTGKGDKVAVWLRDANNLEGVMSVGRLVKRRLGVINKMSFSVHREDSGGRSRYGSQNSPSKIYI